MEEPGGSWRPAESGGVAGCLTLLSARTESSSEAGKQLWQHAAGYFSRYRAVEGKGGPASRPVAVGRGHSGCAEHTFHG